MNRNNKESNMHRATDTVRNFKTHAAVATVALAASPLAAFATTGAPNTGDITTKIAMYVAAAVIIILAWAAGVWGLRAAGLMGKRS